MWRLALALVTAVPASASAGAHVAPADARGTAHVRLRLVRVSPPGNRVVLMLRVEAHDVRMGAYQGTLTFDPSVLVVDSATAPGDGSRFVNAQRVSAGTLRFAGFTTSGFLGADAVRLVAHTRGPLENARIAGVLEVAGDLDGHRLAATALEGTTLIDTESSAPPAAPVTPRKP